MRWLLVVLLLLSSAAPARAAWRLPVDAPVVGRFHVAADRFAAGQRRGVDLAARPGARVVAPCSGVVAFAGRVPRFGLGVSLRCGTLTATVLGLRRVSARGAVRRGATVGVAAGRVRLGARVTSDPFGYRDPLTLVGDDGRRGRPPLVGPRAVRRTPPRPVLAPAPRHPATGSRPAVEPHPATGSRPAVEPHPAVAPRSAAGRAPDAIPPLAWIGLALVACALPSGAIAWRVTRRRAPLPRPRLSRPR